MFSTAACATWKPEYAQNDPENRVWYETRTLNFDTQKRLGVTWVSCCNHSDVVRTKFRVDNVNGADEWWWFDTSRSEWRKVPADVVHYGDPAPDNQPTLFVYQGVETCFYPPEGGT